MDLSKELASFIESAKHPLIVVLGPTASGKTTLSLKIAKEVGGEIISTDSRQLYKGMEIGTDIITVDEQQGIPHHMLGIATPDKPLTLAEYTDLTSQKIREIFGRRRVPILVGGTGLYISAIIEGYDMPRIAPDQKLRQKLQKEAVEKGAEFLHKKLQKLDPKAAAAIHPHNLRYVIRALEINLTAGKNKTSARKKSNYDIFMVGIDWPRAQLYQRINQRVQRQLDRGLVEEVKQLIQKGYQQDLPAMSSLGVKEIIPYIKGEKSLEECVEIIKQSTRRYAKRQMTWFRRYARVRWLSPEEL